MCWHSQALFLKWQVSYYPSQEKDWALWLQRKRLHCCTVTSCNTGVFSSKHVQGTNVNPCQKWFLYIWISSLLAAWPRLPEIFTGGLSRHSRNSKLWSSPRLRRVSRLVLACQSKRGLLWCFNKSLASTHLINVIIGVSWNIPNHVFLSFPSFPLACSALIG